MPSTHRFAVVKKISGLFCALVMFASVASAQAPGWAEKLHLFHRSDNRVHADEFRVSADTKIVLEFGHQSEDRIAAETLVDQIEDKLGMRLDIVGARAGNKGDRTSIVLARLQDPGMREFLASKGLKADDSIGEQGYLLFADRTHLIVAAKTGEGLFQGVQTLRGLLHADGKEIFCPSMALRDWPGLQPNGGGMGRVGPL